ncbi:FAD-dependent oxidoreductase [Streptomonospora halophila]|uniref:FAD-dependent oxidoreductase n=1 Tax=Streptomonospora halophila TaxID=427369 RepID=A0ABP9GQ23_9ACTN
MTPHRIVVLGAGFAGLTAAKRAAGYLRGTPARVTLVNAAEHLVERTRLHQVAAGQRLPEIRIADLLRGSGVEAVFGRVTAIDADARTVHLDEHRDPASPSGGSPVRERLYYDTLVYALGSSWDTRDVPGVAEHAFAVADAEQAARLRDHLRVHQGARPGDGGGRTGAGTAPVRSAAAPALVGGAAAAGGAPEAAAHTADAAPEHPATAHTRHRIVVAGGGLTGLETAAELAEAYPNARVELVSAEAVADWLAPRAQRHLRGSLRRLGVAVREHTAITAVQDGRALVGDGESDAIAFDTLVWTAGFRVHALAAEAGLAVDDTGRILVDASLRSVSHPEVIAAGDAAAAMTRGGVARMTCQTGLPMGVHAGGVAADTARGRAPRPVRLRYVAVNISLGRRDAVTQFLRADDTPVRAALVGRSAAALKEGITRGVVTALRHPGPFLPRRA